MTTADRRTQRQLFSAELPPLQLCNQRGAPPLFFLPSFLPSSSSFSFYLSLRRQRRPRSPRRRQLSIQLKRSPPPTDCGVRTAKRAGGRGRAARRARSLLLGRRPLALGRFFSDARESNDVFPLSVAARARPPQLQLWRRRQLVGRRFREWRRRGVTQSSPPRSRALESRRRARRRRRWWRETGEHVYY